MQNFEDIHEGMQVYDSTDSLIGSVERISGSNLRVGGREIPNSSIERVEGNRIYLSETADMGATGMDRTLDADMARSTDIDRTAGVHEGEVRVPIVEERLTVEKRAGQTGEVNIHRRVVEEQQSAPVELRREEVHVERREVEARPLQPGEEATFDEGTIRVPVRGEEAVVSKEAVVTGEVVVNKEQTTERQEVRDTVRRQEVDVDEDYERFRSGYRQDFDRSTTAGAATWDEAEPRYRYGYAAARDERYAGRDFEEVEPELRHDWEASYGGADPWERLRREIRQGWDRVRNG